jgi:small-conductance mechanosensitive channel
MSAIGAFTILHVAGINLQPLLALGGVSSLVVGLASQQLLTNTVLGFNFVSNTERKCEHVRGQGLV